MNILILGGTQFLGRHLCEQATARGDKVTLFNRGKSDSGLFSINPNVEFIKGDRAEDLIESKFGDFDKVIDCSGHFPAWVQRSCEILKDKTNHYVYLSSVSVYSDFSIEKITEDSPTVNVAGDLTIASPETYGTRKKACEEIVLENFGAKASIIRPGLIVGAYDQTWRFLYWLDRFSRSENILVPDCLNEQIQLISVVDLSQFLLELTVEESYPIMNTVGAGASTLTFQSLWAKLEAYFKMKTKLTAASENYLLDKEVSPWSDLPLWVPASMNGIHKVDSSLAIEAGLRSSSVETIIEQTWDWYAKALDGKPLAAGLSREKERELLKDLLDNSSL